ncbi:M24 family metallopeptidase [Haloplanus pelagicus]|uniref:M24 family metallopeptidase n=1 Tax=Haloplanus pelagicus TaxID=2949995 RepID=UPI00203C8186|nr:M24 family metallopeptidase [Haloplanus sp. HW8-1]
MSDAAAATEAERAVAAAADGIRAVARRLDDARGREGRLHADGEALTLAGLEAAAEAAVVDAGGTAPAARVESPDGPKPGDPVVVAVEPSVEGVPGPCSRTFVVDGGGGWERRAAVAVGMAHDAVRRVVEPGLPARRVVDEAVAELGAYGLGTAATPVARSVGGDRIDFDSDAPLSAGRVFVLAPAAVDPDPDRDHGRVRIGICYLVTESGCRALDTLPTSLSPGAY